MLGYVIGDSDMVTGFRLVGVEGEEVGSDEDAWEALNRALIRSDLALIVISEVFSAKPRLRAEIDKARRERKSPLIVELPGSRVKPSEVRMSDLISKTLGVRV